MPVDANQFSNAWVQNGNSFNALGTIGTIDAFDWRIIVNNVEAVRVQTGTQRVGIQQPSPNAQLEVLAAVSGANVGGAGNNYVAFFDNTSSGVTQNNGIKISAGNNTGVATSLLIEFERPDNTVIGNVTQNAAGTVAYNTSSDARLKEGVVDSLRGLDVLRAIRVRDFWFVGDPSEKIVQGFVAQELEPLYPDAVSVGGEDAHHMPWAVEYGRLTPLLVKALQDLAGEVDELRRAIRRE